MKSKFNQTTSINVTNEFKPIFASVDLWNIHKMVKGRVYRKYF